METILFDKVNISVTSTPERINMVTISYYVALNVCCYRQPSPSDTTLLTCLDTLLDRYYVYILCRQLSMISMFMSLPGYFPLILLVLAL